MRDEPVGSFRPKPSVGWLWVLAITLLMTVPLPYASISGSEVQNLRFSAWSSFRFPGLALWKVPYTGSGQIRMCSTRSHRGVLVITAGTNRYGISPAEEDRFVHSLRAAVERAQGATADTAPRWP